MCRLTPLLLAAIVRDVLPLIGASHGHVIHECCKVGADAARPSSARIPMKRICFIKISLGTCLVRISAGLSAPSTLVLALESILYPQVSHVEVAYLAETPSAADADSGGSIRKDLNIK